MIEKVLRGYVAIMADEASEETSSAGIVISTSTKKEVKTGEVVGVGDANYLPGGGRAEIEVKVGDHVAYKPFQCNEVKTRDKDDLEIEVLVIREEELWLILS